MRRWVGVPAGARTWFDGREGLPEGPVSVGLHRVQVGWELPGFSRVVAVDPGVRSVVQVSLAPRVVAPTPAPVAPVVRAPVVRAPGHLNSMSNVYFCRLSPGVVVTRPGRGDPST